MSKIITIFQGFTYHFKSFYSTYILASSFQSHTKKKTCKYKKIIIAVIIYLPLHYLSSYFMRQYVLLNFDYYFTVIQQIMFRYLHVSKLNKILVVGSLIFHPSKTFGGSVHLLHALVNDITTLIVICITFKIIL